MLARALGLLLLIVGFSMLGGMFFNARRVLPPTENPVILSRNAQSSLSQGIEANARYPNVMQYFYNTAKRSQLDYGVFNNSALIDFYDRRGRLQIQFGTYNTSVRANEDGLSFAGISDDRGVWAFYLPHYLPFLFNSSRGINREY